MKYIHADQRQSYLWITFDRPEKLNCLHADELVGLRDVIAGIDSNVSAVVFTGAGDRAFSAGMNVQTFSHMKPAAAETLITQLSEVMKAIRTSPVVTVAAINGYCLGGAFELALACDLRVVSTTASFGLPEVKVGIPSVIDAALLPHFVGLSLAKEIILSGDIYPLDRFPAQSLANVVVESAKLVDATNALLARVAVHTSTVIAAQRRLFETWLNGPLTASVASSIAEFREVFQQPETVNQIQEYIREI